MVFGTVPDFTGKKIMGKIVWETEGELVWLEPYGHDGIRFRSSKSLTINEMLDWTLLKQEESTGAQIIIEKDRGIITNGKIRAEILGDGTVNYYKRTGESILRELWIDTREGTAPQRKAREYKAISSTAFKTSLYFKANEGEHFYGMGQEPNDCFDLKGCTVELLQKNTKSTIPFVYSTRGYGFIWNNPAIGRAEFVNNHTMWFAEACQQIDYIVLTGESPAEILERYTEHTGRAPMLPEWASGFWQCKLRYKTQDELLDVARKYKQKNIPINVIVADYFHWTQQGEWKFDERYWPDPKAMVEELEELGIKLMVSVWPTVDVRSENYDEMRMKNYLLRAEKGISSFFMFLGPETYVDTTRPEAQKYLWDKLKQHYYDLGIKMFWLDEAEPELRPYDYENVRYYIGNGQEVSNIYPFTYAKSVYDGLTKEGEDSVNLVRCAWLGTQRLGAVVWSGDVASTFDSLRKQMKAGLNIAMCAIPWWTTDIGGFLFGDPEEPEFIELLIRWFQYGAFCPIFRLHGYRMPYEQIDDNTFDGECTTGGPNEVWSFGEETEELIVSVIHLREKFRPYIMKQMKIASDKGTPVMRPLLFDFYEDERTLGIYDEFMLGPDLLVAPVIEYQARTKRVYFPKGTDWICIKTGNRYKGGAEALVDAPLDTIPLFYREGREI